MVACNAVSTIARFIGAEELPRKGEPRRGVPKEEGGVGDAERGGEAWRRRGRREKEEEEKERLNVGSQRSGREGFDAAIQRLSGVGDVKLCVCVRAESEHQQQPTIQPARQPKPASQPAHRDAHTHTHAHARTQPGNRQSASAQEQHQHQSRRSAAQDAILNFVHFEPSFLAASWCGSLSFGLLFCSHRRVR